MGTAANRIARVLAAGIVAAALAVAGAPPHAAALPPGFPSLNDFAPAPVDDYITTGPERTGPLGEFLHSLQHRVPIRRRGFFASSSL